MSRTIDMTGKIYGKWVVLAEAGRDTGGNVTWICRCDCGELKIVRGAALRNGRSTSCLSCAKSDDLTGRVYGNLTVAARNGTSGNNAAWDALCSCGAVTNVSANHLQKGHTTSCGDRKLHPTAARGQGESYPTAHYRVVKAFGKAAVHVCADCPSPAHEWSFSGDESTALRTPGGMAYSMTPADYAPRCILCHRAHDSTTAGHALSEEQA